MKPWPPFPLRFAADSLSDMGAALNSTRGESGRKDGERKGKKSRASAGACKNR